MLPKIVGLPGCCKRFFQPLRAQLRGEHFAHFWRIVVLLAALQGRRSLSAMVAATDERRTRQAISHFLEQDTWDAAGLLRAKAHQLLRQLGWRQGDTLYAVLDDTQKRKRAKRMEAVQKLFLHAEKIYAPGHTIVACTLIYRGVVIPYAVSLWAPTAYCQEQGLTFRKSTELAADMVRGLTLPSPGRVIVLFDAFYLCPAVLAACQERGFAWVGVAKKNRTFHPDGRRRDRRKLARYGQNVLRRHGRRVRVRGKAYRLADRVGQLSRAGDVKLVFSRRGRERAWVVLATNQRTWSAKTVLAHYLMRWGIEVFFKMSKQHLGLGDYQVLRYRAVENHLHLVLIAYLLLTHQALAAADVKAKLKEKPAVLRLPSIPRLQQELRATLWQEALHELEAGTNPSEAATNPRSFARRIKEFLRKCA